jgi:4'-phosphopantetheinyl transferase
MFDPVGISWRLHWTAKSVDVFYIDLQQHCPNDERDALAWLSSEECAHGRRFVCPQARRQYTICRAALRALLSGRLGCCPPDLEISAGQYGKPSAMVRGRRAPLEFSVSHSGNHGLIALSAEGAVGVDVEDMRLRQDFSSIAQSVFTLDEQSWLGHGSAEDRMRRFYRIWTMKEAVVKALGMGLSFDLESFSIPDELIGNASTGHLTLRKGTQELSNQRLNLFALPNVGRAVAALATFVPTAAEHRTRNFPRVVGTQQCFSDKSE